MTEQANEQSIWRTNRFLLISGSVLGITLIVLVMFLTRPTQTPQVVAPVATAVNNEVVFVAFTATPTAVLTAIPTLVPTEVATTTPIATEIPTVVATPCDISKDIVDEMEKIGGLVAFKANLDQALVVETWNGYAVSTGKYEDREVELNGQKYILQIVTVYMFGKKDADRKLAEVPVVVGVTYPNGKFISSMLDFQTKEDNDKGLVPEGSLFKVMVKGDENGPLWDACISGKYPGYVNPYLTTAYCKIGKTLFPSVKALDAIQNGDPIPNGWVLMGAFLNPIETLNQAQTEWTPLTFEMPVCEQ